MERRNDGGSDFPRFFHGALGKVGFVIDDVTTRSVRLATIARHNTLAVKPDRRPIAADETGMCCVYFTDFNLRERMQR